MAVYKLSVVLAREQTTEQQAKLADTHEPSIKVMVCVPQ